MTRFRCCCCVACLKIVSFQTYQSLAWRAYLWLLFPQKHLIWNEIPWKCNFFFLHEHVPLGLLELDRKENISLGVGRSSELEDCKIFLHATLFSFFIYILLLWWLRPIREYMKALSMPIYKHHHSLCMHIGRPIRQIDLCTWGILFSLHNNQTMAWSNVEFLGKKIGLFDHLLCYLWICINCLGSLLLFTLLQLSIVHFD